MFAKREASSYTPLFAVKLALQLGVQVRPCRERFEKLSRRLAMTSIVLLSRAIYQASSPASRYAPVVAECKHGVKIERCFDCRQPPEGVNGIVYITKGGSMFHNIAGCRYITVGQAIATAQGMNIHPIESVPYSQVALERDRCPSCCP